jgi:hypothetical protein
MADAEEGADDGAEGLSALFGDDGEADGDRETEPVDATADPVTKIDVQMDGLVGVYEHTRHRNGDETAIIILGLGDGYQALAIDAAQDGEVLATKEIGAAEAAGRAVSQAEYWRDQHPDGILGSVDEDGGGLLETVFGGGT